VNVALSEEFQSLLRAFQGDFLSGCLFTLVLAGALNELRLTITVQLDRPIPQISVASMPLDSEYADDVNFNDEDEDNLRVILPQAIAIQGLESLCQGVALSIHQSVLPPSFTSCAFNSRSRHDR
jgi:hypothetical protein